MMKQMTIRITTLSPVVLTTSNSAALMTASHNYISGTVLRGVMAGRYIDKKALQIPHADDGFRQLFFGGLRFTDAYPLSRVGRAFVLPRSLQKSKDGTQISDLLQEGQESSAGFKSCKGIGVVKGNQLATVQVRKNVSLHMSRNAVKERLSGKSEEGHIYNYEALAPGQVFEGTVLGEEADLKSLVDALQMENRKIEGYIGRSKYTEYGKCRISVSNIEDIPSVEVPLGATMYVRLESAFIPCDASSVVCAERALAEFTAALQEKTGHDFQVERMMAASVCIHNFVGVWHMKRPSQQAIAAGTVFALTRIGGDWESADVQALQELGYAGVGQRTEEGFGQLRLWLVSDTWQPGQALYPVADAKDCDRNDTQSKTCELKSAEVRGIAQQVVLQRILEQARIRAHYDVERLPGLQGKAHLFARLENLLGARENLAGIQQRFPQALKDAEDKATQGKMKKHLQNMRFLEKNLWDILCDKEQLPFKEIDWKQNLPDTAERLMKEIQFKNTDENRGAVFYEYWLWFFRHARKRAVMMKEEAE